VPPSRLKLVLIGVAIALATLAVIALFMRAHAGAD
jgi:hypothetical protein